MFLMPGSRARILPKRTVSSPAPGGRLTLTSGTPVMSATVSGATTVYYTPYVGSVVPIYNGTYFDLKPTIEMSQTTTDTTKSPAAVAASSVYDIFVWNNAGTLRATRGPAWSNTTTRGYTLTNQNGINLNTSAITNGPGALRGTWVGTIASNASSTIDWIIGGTANGGTAGSLMVWNTYNRRYMVGTATDNTSYSYTTATIRQAHASAGNQVSFVLGAQEDATDIAMLCGVRTVAAVGAFLVTGVGLDTTTTFTIVGPQVESNTAILIQDGIGFSAKLAVPIGVHKISKNELGDGSNANTFNNPGSGATASNDFISVSNWM